VIKIKIKRRINKTKDALTSLAKEVAKVMKKKKTRLWKTIKSKR
jgi:hypothetical protein